MSAQPNASNSAPDGKIVDLFDSINVANELANEKILLSELQQALANGSVPYELIDAIATSWRERTTLLGGCGLATVSAFDLLSEPPKPMRMLIEGLLEEGDLGFLIGPAKSMKTWFAMQLALALAGGGSFLGFPIRQTQRVLYVNAELKAEGFQRRLHELATFLGLKDRPSDSVASGWRKAIERLHVLNGRGKALTVEAIAETTTRICAGVVIIDPAYLLIQGSEIEQKEVSEFLRQIDEHLTAKGLTVVIVHHDTKGSVANNEKDIMSRGSGSSLFGRKVDLQMVLSVHQADPDSEDGILHFSARARELKPPPPLSLRFTRANGMGGFLLLPDTPAEKATKRPAGAAKHTTPDEWEHIARRVLSDAPGGTLTLAMFDEKLHAAGVKGERLRRVRPELVSRGVIVQRKPGKYRLGSADVVALAE